MLSSPRRPSSTTGIFSSAEKCRRVARRMSLTICSAGAFTGPDFCLIFAPDGYDDPEILRSRKPSICLIGADGRHLAQVALGDVGHVLVEDHHPVPLRPLARLTPKGLITRRDPRSAACITGRW